MNSAPQHNRRRILLVDHLLQKSLLVALVSLETIVLGIAIWALYRALGGIVDENMYRIHFSESVNVMSQLTIEGMRVLGGMLLANLLALIIADRIWAFYVHGILRDLGRLIAASRQLDFSEPEPVSFDHSVIEQAMAWRDTESARLAEVRERIKGLPPQLPASAQERDAVATALAKLQEV